MGLFLDKKVVCKSENGDFVGWIDCVGNVYQAIGKLSAKKKKYVRLGVDYDSLESCDQLDINGHLSNDMDKVIY